MSEVDLQQVLVSAGLGDLAAGECKIVGEVAIVWSTKTVGAGIALVDLTDGVLRLVPSGNMTTLEEVESMARLAGWKSDPRLLDLVGMRQKRGIQ